ncbi:DEAD/DEAH box helicase [Rhodococcus sp. DMU2021]|uniref:DEAD/DEAH box helicase n=1 Tax=Rhodococcus sp. DMU2021 TaxID=2866997 RepID=UPI001C7D2464|nr:DEAD/DEAH box helicase [Rhodococcus sp. DMU2021]MBX4167619.1 DEAD/DEAH box helicase [Rhodococcus sp. DMU2021]
MSGNPAFDHLIRSLIAAVGGPTFDRGSRYAERGAVVDCGFDEDDLVGFGRIAGTRMYQAVVQLHPGPRGLEYEHGECSCPVGYDCKHTVALLLTLLAPQEDTTPKTPSWEAPFEAMFEDHETGNGVPLALQLALTQRAHAPAPMLTARVLRPGRTGWVSGNISWQNLAYTYDVNKQHQQLLLEFAALVQASTRSYYSSASSTVDLSAVSPRLWSLLDDARRLGIELRYAKKKHGAVPPPGAAEVHVDVADVGDGLTVTPALHISDDSTGAAVAFIGAPAHGVVYLPSGDHDGGAPADLPFRLAQLRNPVAAGMQRLLQSGGALTVPADQVPRFATTYYPRLHRAATVTSVDGSFTAPTVTEPALLLHVAFRPQHRADLHWQFVYTVGDGEYTVELYEHLGDTVRDRDVEDALLTEIRPVVAPFGLDNSVDRQLFSRVTIVDLNTARLVSEVLPLLSGRDDVQVRVEGTPADYRDVGDSLRIGLSTKATADSDWFDLDITIELDGTTIPFREVFTALSDGAAYLMLPDGAYLPLDKPELQQLRRLVDEARALHEDDDPDRLQLSRFQAGIWEELAALGVVDKQAAAWKKQVQGLLDVKATAKTRVPKALQATLRPYQLDGFRWLTFLWTHGLGGILADDMGLGKTLQSLALICHARAKRPADAPVLIVAPTSVVPNWATEARRFAPDLNVVAITETSGKRGASLGELIDGIDVAVTSYTLLRLDIDDYLERDWSMLLLDEAQFVKNHRAKAYQCVRQIEAPLKVAITGTPMENNLMELWSLLSITAPGLFPHPTKFQDYYRKPIETGSNPELLVQLRQRIKPLMLRRTKEQVATDLPEKQEQVLEVELAPKHRALYDRQLQRERQKILGLVDDLDSNRFTILRSLTLLRQMSLDPALVDDAHGTVGSAKIDALLEQLDDVIAGGHRALVFSQFTGFFDRVRTRLDAAGIDYLYLDGKTRKRGKVLEDFKSGVAPVFLISLKAGGFGLNLVEADYCFLLDPWWNPATEAQAVDRTHRIGQTRNVMVYRLIARDTIEAKVRALQLRKAELFSSVVDDGEMFSSALTADDIRALLA